MDAPTSISAAPATDLELPPENRLLEQLKHAWEQGFQLPVERLLDENPELRQQPEQALELVYEEICQRHRAGLPVDRNAFATRFPQWARQIRVLIDCHRMLDGQGGDAAFPGAGERLGDFQLLAELGKGARGRVFLATQSFLADRQVVVKLTPSNGREHLSLARLQHTHIVPLYSIEEDRTRNVRAMCMPYFGGASLDQVLGALRGIPLSERRGSDFLQALDAVSANDEASRRAGDDVGRRRTHARRSVAELSYVDAVCRMGFWLADALAYAHDRGLVHLDIKPSNVLITAEGEPMLLDFHLAHDPIDIGGPLPDWLGGTPGYMSPEQERALCAIRRHQPVPDRIDGRSDIFSLAIVMYEALHGDSPVAKRAGQFPRHPVISRGVADIIDKCLADKPEDRYESARDLAADLHRHLKHMPLAGVRNRSPVESWRKWRRREPEALRWWAVSLLAILVVAGAGAWFTWYRLQQAVQAKSALREGTEAIAIRNYGQAIVVCERGRDLAQYSGDAATAAALDTALLVARRRQAAADVHGLVEQLRYDYGSDDLPAKEREMKCSLLWSDRQRIIALWPGQAARDPAAVEIRQDLMELAVLRADLRVRFVPPEGLTTARQQALEMLNEAEILAGPNVVLSIDRARYGGKKPNGEVQAQSAWEHYAIGRLHLRDGDYKRASQSFEEALTLEPGGFWPNFYAGLCDLRLSHYEDAAIAFTACIPLAANPAVCLFNRSLAFAGSGRLGRALDDLDSCLRLDAHYAAARLQRGRLRYRIKQFGRAEQDMRAALRDGAKASDVHLGLAKIELARGDRKLALAEAKQATRDQSPSREALELLRRLQGGQ